MTTNDHPSPIPLTSPDGTIYGYACPRCHVVAMAGEPMVYVKPGQHWFVELVESSRAKATKCCLCFDCDAEVGDRGSIARHAMRSRRLRATR
jgi:hypothetical protein